MQTIEEFVRRGRGRLALGCLAFTVVTVVVVWLVVATTLEKDDPAIGDANNNNNGKNKGKGGKFVGLPLVVNTWPFTVATAAAWANVSAGGSNLDAVVAGCTACEVNQCDHTVGYGGSPDTNGETTLDAGIMDGKTFDVGAVGCLRRVKNAIGVARAVMDHTQHSLLAGDLATAFAVSMGFEETNLTTEWSWGKYEDWVADDCQPNYFVDVVPPATSSCGPYSPGDVDKGSEERARQRRELAALFREGHGHIHRYNHDTIGMVSVDVDGNVAAGTSTNGLNHKVAGRVGDSPIPGAGFYAANWGGGCGATGDGDVMLRVLPCYQAVENLRLGMSPDKAAEDALTRIHNVLPDFQGALVVATPDGRLGAAALGWTFKYSYAAPSTNGEVVVVDVEPIPTD